MQSKSGPCELCGRTVKRGTTAHHLIPRTCHGNKWFQKNFTRDVMRVTVELCRDCHSEIHKQIPSEKELGRHYNTLEKLLSHPKIGSFVKWIRKQS